MTGFFSRAAFGTNRSPSAFGVSEINSALSKSKSASVAGVLSRVRPPAPSSTIATPLTVSNRPR